MQLRGSKRASDLVFSCFIINYSYFKTSLKNRRMTWVIYLASFIYSGSAKNIARGLESLLRRVQLERF